MIFLFKLLLELPSESEEGLVHFIQCTNEIRIRQEPSVVVVAVFVAVASVVVVVVFVAVVQT